VTGRIYAVGGGRLARVAFTESRGWIAPEDAADNAPELTAAHLAQADDMRAAVVLDTQEQSMALLTEFFPFGGIPFLTQEAVVGAGRTSPDGGEGEANR
jgi:hypothetical protein